MNFGFTHCRQRGTSCSYVEKNDAIFFKTIIPSRKAANKYVRAKR